MKNKEKQQAREMRQKGVSLNKISKELHISKSTASGWTQDIELSSEQRKILLKRNPNAQKGNQIKKAVRDSLKAQWKNDGYELAKNSHDFALLCSFYWGEGWKKNNENAFSLANSDPKMIRKVLKLITIFTDKTPKIYINAHADYDFEIIALWWKNFLNLGYLPKVYRCVSKSSTNQLKGNLPNGTAQIKFGAVELIQKIFGGINYLSE